nr:MAG TPA: hypothetical protein [Crassvirales sp.]DAN22688.1 MAG TPA_asm: hypothetical protein [Bacteriophage sp.]DAT39830.1 MAG TPA: hypothetical protein [Caudoviricetes sp.]
MLLTAVLTFCLFKRELWFDGIFLANYFTSENGCNILF